MGQFNQKAADSVYSVISKMDDDSALMFSRMLVHDMLHADIENNRRTVNSFTQEILEGIRTDVAKSLVGRGDEGLATAAMVGLVSKDWNEQHWVREGGRFAGYKGPKSKPKPNAKPKLKTETYRNPSTGQRKVVVRDKRSGKSFDVTGALSDSTKSGNEFAQRWNRESDGRTNEQTYNRIAAGSRLMSQVGAAAGSPSMVLAGEVGQMAGNLGPSAEQVIGPSMRKTAYRYRGTERQVDPNLSRDTTRRVATHLQAEKMTPAQLTGEDRTELSRMSAMSYLQQRLPDKKLSELQRQSGKLPPSEGVIINADGKIITQAVGYQEDHFLPFNLKNLKGLNGGSYVRTRSSGGLTSEDIYTGLMSNARSVTVVSRSGVFTLDFEDDFRGQRRYSDKARQMVKRYESTLDTIQSETVSRRSLQPEERAQIRDEVESELSFLSNTFDGRKQIEDTIKQREKQYQSASHLTSDEIKSINERAKKMAADPNFNAINMGDRAGGERGRPVRLPQSQEAREKFIRSELISAAMDEKQAMHYRLDGEGYETALNALAEQYPYFIAGVRSQTRSEATPASRERDTGYVSPGANRPNAVRAGYFGPEQSGRARDAGKFSAAETNYQRPKDRGRPQRAQEPSTAPEGAKPKETPSSGLSRPQSVQERRRTVDNQVKADAALASMAAAAVSNLSAEDLKGFPALNKLSEIDGSDDERNIKIQDAIKSPIQRQAVLREVEQIRNSVANSDNNANQTLYDTLTEHKRTYETRQRQASNKVFSQDSYRESPEVPFKFDDVVPDQTPEQYRSQFQQVSGGVNINAVSDEGLRKLAQSNLIQAAAYENATSDSFDSDDAMRSMSRLGVNDQTVDQVIMDLDNIAETGDNTRAQSTARRLRAQAAATEKARAVLREYESAQSVAQENTRKITAQAQRANPRSESITKLRELKTLESEVERRVNRGDVTEDDLATISDMAQYAQNVSNGESSVADHKDEFRQAWSSLSPGVQRMASDILGGSAWDDLNDDDDDY